MPDEVFGVGPDYQLPEALWERIVRVLPPPTPKKKDGRPRMDERQAMTAMVSVWRTGCPWKALPHGLPLGVAVDGANRHDMKRVEAPLEAILIKRPRTDGDVAAAPVPGQGVRRCRGTRNAGGVGVDGAHSPSRRRSAGHARASRRSGAPLGGGTHTLLDEPPSAVAHPVGKEGGELVGSAPFCVCLDYLSGCRTFRIGSKCCMQRSAVPWIRSPGLSSWAARPLS